MKEIVAAMDNDAAGQTLTAAVREVVELAGRDDLAFRVHQPENVGKDWNQVLQSFPERPASFPVALP